LPRRHGLSERADVAAPSWPGADWRERAAWVPDLVTFGKVVGGGMPLAAVGGRTEVMDLLAPDGPVYQAGTLSGNPLATAAGLATLQLADDAVYASVAEHARTIGEVVSAALTEQGVPHRVQRAGSLFSFMFGQRAAEQGVSDYEAARAQETWRYGPFFHAFLEAGVGLPPSVFEAWFVSAAHGEAELEALDLSPEEQAVSPRVPARTIAPMALTILSVRMGFLCCVAAAWQRCGWVMCGGEP